MGLLDVKIIFFLEFSKSETQLERQIHALTVANRIAPSSS